MNHHYWSWLPNGLTSLRLAAGVAFPWVPAQWQFTVLLVAGGTDLVDGLLGRWLRVTSSFGRIADPIADKVLVLAAVACALKAEWLSWPALLALTARDLMVIVLSALALARRRDNWRRLTPRISGKIATGAQVVALLAMYLTQHAQPILVGIAGGISILSALDYARHAACVAGSTARINRDV